MTPTQSGSQVAAGPQAEETTVTTYAWYVCIILTLCYTISYIDRQILGTVVGPIQEEFSITDAQFGMLQGLGFAAFYTFLGLPLGRMVDRHNRRNLVVAGVVVWSIFTASCALASSYNMLFISRIGVGVGEATLGPAAMSLLADYFPRNRLGLAASIFYIGNLVGASLALIIGGAVRESVADSLIVVPLFGALAGWRLIFLLLGIPGIIFAMLVFTIREPKRKGLLLGPEGEALRPTVSQAIAEVKKRWQSVLGISVAFSMQAACNYGFMAWSVEHFLRAHDWQPGQTTLALGIILASCGIGGLYFGGWLADKWQSEGVTDATLKVAIPSALGALIFLPAAMAVPSATWNLILAAPGLFCVALPMGTAGAALQHIFPNQVRGQVTALFLFILNIGGLPIGNILPGLLTTYVLPETPYALGYAVAITIALCAFAMFLCISYARSYYRRDYAAMHGVA